MLFKTILAVLFVLGGGALLAERSYAEPPRNAAPAAAEPAGNYRLSAGDLVAITVFREPDLTAQQRISRDGTITFPLLGVVKLAGKNTNEAAAHLAALLDKDFLVRPQVSLSIVTYAKVKFTVLGQVASPGSFDLPEEQSIDILSALARAGGFTRLANPANVLVRRVQEGKEETFKVDVKRIMSDPKSPPFMIQPNDTINVGERFF